MRKRTLKVSEIDEAQTLRVHRATLLRNPLMRWVYERWYEGYVAAHRATEGLGGSAFELGSGAGFAESVVPGLVKTDVVENPYADRIMDAQSLPLAEGEARLILALGVLHHLERPRDFFRGCVRALRTGGRVVLIEPSDSLLHRFMIWALHPYEYFDGKVHAWEQATKGRLSDANNAIPSIVFLRDRGVFESEFPELEIISIERHTVLSYYLSGGMSYRLFLPRLMLPLGRALEWLVTPLRPWLGTMMTITLVRTPTTLSSGDRGAG